MFSLNPFQREEREKWTLDKNITEKNIKKWIFSLTNQKNGLIFYKKEVERMTKRISKHRAQYISRVSLPVSYNRV